jgi:hypothetical protein
MAFFRKDLYLQLQLWLFAGALALPAAALGAPAAAPSSGPSPFSQVAGLALGPQDDIDAADFAIDTQGTLHVVWRSLVKRPGSTALVTSVSYARGEQGGRSWSTPIVLEATLGEPPRLALAQGVVHVFFGPKLRHFAGDGRGAFRELPPLVPAGRARAVACDATSAGDGVLVAYLAEVPAAAANGRALELHLAGGSAGGPPDRTVARFPGSALRQPAPRLLATGDRLDLLAAVNLEGRSDDTSSGRPVERYEPFGRVVFLSSADRGATWIEPVELGGLGRGRSAEGRTRPLTVAAVELATHRGALLAFWSAYGLWGTRSADGRSFSPARALAPYEPSLSEGATESGAVAAAAGAPDGVLAWIDARFKKSDRRWWNPLGGFPWSDADPLWANNDIFTLSLSAVEGALAGRPAVPRRLTPPLSLARTLSARAGTGGGAVLLWAGRARAGRQPASAGQPPALFFTWLSAAAAGGASAP